MEMAKCKNCGSKFSRSDNLRRHEKSCVVQNKSKSVMETSITYKCVVKTNNDVASLVNPLNKEDLASKKDDSKWTSFIDAVINKNQDDDNNNLIQPLKSISMDHMEDNMTRNSKKREPIEEILSTQKTARKMKHYSFRI